MQNQEKSALSCSSLSIRRLAASSKTLSLLSVSEGFLVNRSNCLMKISIFLGNPPADQRTPEVEFSRSLSRGGSMKKSRFTDSQILAVLKQAEAGIPVPQLCREHGIS